jgi:2-succinyl-6-hydroxy-2,4-cyclohexadiene-1-carboxylate synthase
VDEQRSLCWVLRPMSKSPMHVEIHASRSGPYLLLVHGICSSRAQWRPNLECLAKFCTPVVVELLGHGRSDSPRDPEAYTVEAYIERFEALRAELGAERWAICGQSFGAGLTMNYALAYPSRVSRQIFTNSNSALRAPAAPVGRDEQLRRAAAFERRGRAGLEGMAFYPKRTGRLAPEIEDELVLDAGRISLAAMALTIGFTVGSLSVADRLAQIATPTLLVNGRREKAFQPARDLAAKSIRDIEVVDLEGGHPVNLDCAAEFNSAVAAFLAP